MNNTSFRYAYIAWGSVSLFFLYQYIIRVSPGIMENEIRHSFHLNAEAFSLFGALYLYAYSFLQIPLGIIVDKIGMRRTVTISVILCIISSVILSVTDDIYYALFARILAGAGSASAFMCAIKIATDYLPEGKRGFLMGATLAMGGIGAFIAAKPIVYIIQTTGWRDVFHYLAALGLIMLLISMICIPKTEINVTNKNYGLIKKIKEIITNTSIMSYAIIAIGLYTPLCVLADLWGAIFLAKKFNLSHGEAANSAMILYVGMVVGSLILSTFFEKYKQINLGIQISSVSMLILFGILLYSNSLSYYNLVILLFMIGFFCGGEMICFTGALQYANNHNSGLTIGIVNTLNMIGGGIAQQIIGKYLDANWSGKLDMDGIRLYTTEEFVNSFSILMIFVILCTLLSFIAFKKKI